jgi:hypothetical protein
MADVYKVLAKDTPASSGDLFSLYVVPTSTSTIVSNITVVNRGSSSAIFSIMVGEDTVGNDSYVYRDAEIAASSTEILEPGITLGASGSISFSGTTDMTVSAYGVELAETGKYKVLGQSYADTASWQTLYTVGSGKSAVVKSISIACKTAETNLKIAIVPTSGDSPTDDDYILFGQDLAVGETVLIKSGYTLASGNTIKVYATSGALSFNVFGAELG